MDGTARALIACAIAANCHESVRLHKIARTYADKDLRKALHSTAKSMVRAARLVGYQLSPCPSCCECGGPMSPSNGHMYTKNMGMCGICTRRVFKWVSTHTNKRPSKRNKNQAVSFYEVAGKK